MATRVVDWCGELCLTAGQGNLQLGGLVAPGYVNFSQSLADGDGVWYAIIDGENREAGFGTYDSNTNEIERTRVDATLIDGVLDENAPAPLILTGTSEVYCTFNRFAYEQLFNNLEAATSNITTLQSEVAALQAADGDNVKSVSPGSNIDVDNSDPQNPSISLAASYVSNVNTQFSNQQDAIDAIDTDVDNIKAEQIVQDAAIVGNANAIGVIQGEQTVQDGRLDAVELSLTMKLEDAPQDGNQYARQDGNWVIVSGGGGGVDPTQPLTVDNDVLLGGSVLIPGPNVPISNIAKRPANYGDVVVSVDTAGSLSGPNSDFIVLGQLYDSVSAPNSSNSICYAGVVDPVNGVSSINVFNIFKNGSGEFSVNGGINVEADGRNANVGVAAEPGFPTRIDLSAEEIRPVGMKVRLTGQNGTIPFSNIDSGDYIWSTFASDITIPAQANDNTVGPGFNLTFIPESGDVTVNLTPPATFLQNGTAQYVIPQGRQRTLLCLTSNKFTILGEDF